MIIFSQGTNRHCYSKACASSKEGKLTPWLKSSTTFLLPQAVNSIMRTCIKQLPHLYKQAHGSSSTPPTRPFIYLLTKLGTCTPTHKNTPSARARPDNKNMSIHTLRAGKKNTNMPSEKQPVREGHGLCTSKNVKMVCWFFSITPRFPSADICM